MKGGQAAVEDVKFVDFGAQPAGLEYTCNSDRHLKASLKNVYSRSMKIGHFCFCQIKTGCLKI